MSLGRGSEKLPRSSRIRSSRDFRRIGREGRRFAASHFVLLVGDRGGSRREDAAIPVARNRGARLGLTASRRVGNAVQRNRVKRQVREWFRKIRSPEGRDWVVIARRGAARLHTHEIEEQLGALAEQAAHPRSLERAAGSR